MTDRTQAGQRPVVEEVHFRNESVYVCLVVNRRHRTARVVDFLAGNFPQKQQAIDAIALKEGIERVYTLVEREESLGWAKVGYVREGNIPGYYKRSDAYLMGHLVKSPAAFGPEGVPVGPLADVGRAEKTLAAARKLLPTLGGPARSLRAQVLSEREFAAQGKSARGRRAAWFEERFGRTGERFHVVARGARGGTRPVEQVVAAELQEPFSNAYVQLGTWPTSAQDARCLVAALGTLGEQLKTRDIGCMFAVAPATDATTSAAMLAAGYRKSGLLAQHLVVGDKRVDTILWSRKSASNAADADAA